MAAKSNVQLKIEIGPGEDTRERGVVKDRQWTHTGEVRSFRIENMGYGCLAIMAFNDDADLGAEPDAVVLPSATWFALGKQYVNSIGDK